MAVSLRVVRGRLCGIPLDFPDGEFVLGGGPECAVRVSGDLISRQHCLLRIRGHDVHVRDLGSTNGTLVNGTLIVEECALSHCDTLQLGPLVLQLVLHGQAPDTADDAKHDWKGLGHRQQ
jgi:pSer/pThr/pTyr-binding forkhead associated (FHA) protein